MSSQELFFHASCFDGAVSCLLLWDYVDGVGRPRHVDLLPIGYDVRERWLSQRLSSRAAVVDFLFHPDAAFWADHHETTFLTTAAQETYFRTRSSEWIYEPTARSCAGLLYSWLAKERGHRNPFFEEVVRWAERIDSADYDSPEDAVFPRLPAASISQSFAVRPADYSVHVVRQLRRLKGDVAAVASEPAVRDAIDEARRRTRLGMERFNAAAKRLPDGIVLFDVEEGSEGAIVSRYAPFIVDPTARYSLGIVRRAGDAKITTMRNPWIDFPSVDLGSLCARLGGGGHHRVASIVLPGAQARRGGDLLQSLLKGIREADHSSVAIRRVAQ